MAITRKPRKAPDGVDVEALISRGGTASERTAPARAKAAPSDAGTVQVILRLPKSVLDDVNRAVQARRVRTPRHTWLVEAVVEKLDREGK